MRRALSILVLAVLAVATPSSVGRPAGAPRLPTVLLEGQAYVELDQVASIIRTKLDATPSSIHAYLRSPGHTVTLTRNWASVLIDGKPLVLDAPVRVLEGIWLVPDSFVDRVMPSRTRTGASSTSGLPSMSTDAQLRVSVTVCPGQRR